MSFWAKAPEEDFPFTRSRHSPVPVLRRMLDSRIAPRAPVGKFTTCESNKHAHQRVVSYVLALSGHSQHCQNVERFAHSGLT